MTDTFAGIVSDSLYVPAPTSTFSPANAADSAAVIVKKGLLYLSSAAVTSLPYTASTRSVFPRGVANGPVGPVTPVGPVGPVHPVGPDGPVAPVFAAVPAAPVGPVGPVGPFCVVPTFPTPGMYLYKGGPDNGGTTLISYLT